MPLSSRYNIDRVVIRFCRALGGVCVQEEEKRDKNRSAHRFGTGAAISAEKFVLSPTPQGPFGPPALLEGEDAATYDQILARICVTVKPVDIIDEMHTADAVYSEWEVLRYHRWKRSLIQELGRELLRGFVLAGPLMNINIVLRDARARKAEELVQEYVRRQPDAVKLVQ